MRRVLKWVGSILGALLGLLVLAFAVLSFIGSARLNRSYDIPPESVTIPTDEAAIARGQHLAEAVSLCVGCHGDNLEGSVLEEDPPIVTLAATNLTRGLGGVGSSFDDADYVRAIRHGVGPDGRALMIMHSDFYHNFSERDLAAVIAYIKSVPPADNEIPQTAPGPVGRAMLPLGVFDLGPIPLFPAEVIDHSAPFAAAPPVGTTAEYGEYLASIALCQMCHGPDMAGGPPLDPESLPGPNLAIHASAGRWTLEDFISTIRTGITPAGRMLNAEAMPWEFYAKMTDEELAAIWLYLESLGGN